MITRTERERTRRAKVVHGAIWGETATWGETSEIAHDRCFKIVDALDLLDNEDEASFKAAEQEAWPGIPQEAETTERKPPLHDHGIGAFVENYTPKGEPQFEGKPLQDPPGERLQARKLPAYVHQLDDANGAEIQDWTWFKGCLFGILIAVAFYGAAWWGMTYYD